MGHAFFFQTVVKERNESGIKKNSVEVHKFLEELVKIGD